MLLSKCPRCGAKLIKTESISGGPSTDWMECSSPTCNTYVDMYTPMPHQIAVHEETHPIIGNFGSYGTGKTKTDEKEVEKHILITPGASILVGANVSAQYKQTIERDFERSFPAAFVKNRSVQDQYIDFLNNARLSFKPFDDPDKLRSNNFTLAIMLEASEIKAGAFHELKARLRGNEPIVKDDNTYVRCDWRKIICESNPDSGWIRTDVVLVSDKIEQHGELCKEVYDIDKESVDPYVATHIASTDANIYLPDDYIAINSKNKPDWWVRRFLHGSFLFAEGLVYPSYVNAIVPTPRNFKLNPKYKVLAAHDYGLQDPSTFEFGYVDTDRGKLVIYKDIRTNDTSVKDLADLFRSNCADIGIGQWYTTPIIDPKNNKRDYDKVDLITHYQEYGVSFQPGDINREARIFRLNDYFEQGRIEIFDCCVHLINELREYKFKPRTLNEARNAKDEPIEVNDHSICALEWITMKLPADPKHLYLDAYDAKGRAIKEIDRQVNNGGWQLGSDDTYDIEDTAYGIKGGYY